MNERIKELSDKAEKWCYANLALPTPKEHNEKFLQKFAELIIWDCANWIDDQPLESIHDNYLNGWELLEHFGVDNGWELLERKGDI